MGDIDYRKFTELVTDDHLDAAVIDRMERGDFIHFYRSEFDGEWYVKFGHETGGAACHVSGTFKANCDDVLDDMHGASEMVTVFNVEKWGDK